MHNQLIFVKQLLYDLKRRYGYPLELYKYLSYDVDPKTGLRTTTRQVVYVKRAIVLPSTLARKFEYDRAFIASNRDFTYGAQFDINTRQVIIDAQDLPKDFNPELDYSAIYEQNRYQVKTMERLDNRLGFMLTLIKVKGAIKQEIVTCLAYNNFLLTHSAANT